MTARERLRLGLAIPAPAVAWLLLQQAGGALDYAACGSAGPPLVPALGIVALLVCLAAGWTGWRGLRDETGERRFAPMLALGGATIFALACLATTAAALVIPPCAR